MSSIIAFIIISKLITLACLAPQIVNSGLNAFLDKKLSKVRLNHQKALDRPNFDLSELV